MNLKLLFLCFCSLMTFAFSAFADLSEESTPDIILRKPASSEELLPRDQLQEMTARIERITDSKTFTGTSYFRDWVIGEVVAVESQNPTVGIVAFVEVTSVEQSPKGYYVVKFQLLRHSRTNMLQAGDTIYRLDLSTENKRYKGTTDLIIKRRNAAVSARYKPLFTQGVNIGTTAQSLWDSEVLITYYGQLYYGLSEKLTIGSLLPLDLAGSFNGNFKYKFFESDANTLNAGLSYAKIPNASSSAVNLDLFWDSISSESTVSHTFLTLAIYTFKNAEDTSAIKSLGTTSFQTGYEFILNNWDRVVLGPTYNVEKQAIGGYVSYIMIWDKFHLAVSANSTNIRTLKLDVQDGYYFFFDAYWRL
jgi:hypothetical protein